MMADWNPEAVREAAEKLVDDLKPEVPGASRLTAEDEKTLLALVGLANMFEPDGHLSTVLNEAADLIRRLATEPR